MKSIKLLTVILSLSLAVGSAQGQVTPQAVIGNAPSLPTPQQWVSNKGHTDSFKAKIAELNVKLNEMQAAMAPDVSPDKMFAAQQQQQQQLELQRQQNMAAAQQGMAEMAAMGITEADLKRMQNMSEKQIEAFMRQKMASTPEMKVLSSMGITQADMDKMSKMNEKQAEAYMKKRLADNGFTEADFRKRMEQAGVKMMSEAEMRDTERRDRETIAQGEAVLKAQEALKTYMDQMRVTGSKIDEARQSAIERIEALRKSRQPAIDAANAYLNELGGPEEIMRGTITKEEYAARESRVQSLADDCEATVYQIWTEYIHAAQGYLKFLMPYAQAADDAKKTQAAVTSTGNETLDQLQKMSNNAASVASQYLAITASEPVVKP